MTHSDGSTRIAYLSHFAILVFIPASSFTVYIVYPQQDTDADTSPLIMYLYQIILLVDVRIYSLFRFILMD